MMPTDWKVVKLQDTNLTIIDGDRGNNYPKSDEFTDDGFCLFLSAKNITKNGFRLDEKQFISEEKDNLLRKGKLKDLDIIITTRGSVGHIAYNENIRYKNIRINSGMVILRNNDEEINQKFVYKLFASNVIQRQIEKIAFGSAQPQLTVKEINNLKIPLPPLKEQEKIADILSTADEKIDAIELQIQKAETLKKGLLQKLLSEGIGHSEFKDSELGKIPESWDIVNVEDITDTHKQGYYTKDEYTGEGTYLIRITDLGNPKIDYSDMPILPISDTDYKSFKVNKGDFLFARSGAIGRYGIVYEDKKAVFASYLIRFTFQKNKIINEYFGYFYETKKAINQLLSITQGSSNININANNIKSIKLALPPLEEQKQIAGILSTADEKLEILRAKKEKYETLKKGLLQKLLSGEVRV